MSWVDSMRLRQRADKVRAVGWVNFALSTTVAVVQHELWALLALWAGGALGTAYGLAHSLERKADRVVTRCCAAANRNGSVRCAG